MPKSINKVILVGRLGRDAETKTINGGSAISKFSVATDRSWKDKTSGEWKSETEWSNVTIWNYSGANHLAKGKQVYVEGRLNTRSYDKNGQKVYVTEVNAETVILLGDKAEGGSGYGRSGEHPLSEGRLGVTEDDIPDWAK